MTVNFSAENANADFKKRLAQPHTNQRQPIQPIGSQSVRTSPEGKDSFSLGAKVLATTAAAAGIGAGLRYGHLHNKFNVEFKPIAEEGFVNGAKKVADKVGAGVTDAVVFVKKKLNLSVSEAELSSQTTRVSTKIDEIGKKKDEIINGAGEKKDSLTNYLKNFTEETDKVVGARTNVIKARNELKAAEGDAKTKAEEALKKAEEAEKDLREKLCADGTSGKKLSDENTELYDLQIQEMEARIKQKEIENLKTKQEKTDK